MDKTKIKDLTKLVRDMMNDYDGEDNEIHSYNILECCCGNEEAEKYVLNKIKEIVRNEVEETEVEYIAKEIYKKEYGLSVIHDLVENKEKKYNNIECIGFNHIAVEKSNGTWERLDLSFEDEEEFKTIIRRAIQHDNKADINAENALVESKRKTGERITAGVSPAGYTDYLFIKLFNSFNPAEDTYLKSGAVDAEIIKFTKIILKIYPALALIGGINRGKTSFLKYLIGYLGEEIKIGTLETDFELKLQEMYPGRNIVSMQETPYFNILSEFKWMLRANRDAVIVGEARGSEVSEAAKASRRGLGLTFLTAHVIDPESLPEEFAQMHLESGSNMDVDFLMYRYAKAFNLTYRIRQLEDGSRVLDDISELVTDRETRTYKRNIIFNYDVQKREHVRVGGIQDKELLMKMDYYNLTDYEKAYLTNTHIELENLGN